MLDGDSYVILSDDALTVSEILGIPMNDNYSVQSVSFPKDKINSYLSQIVRAGKNVAIAEELEDTKEKKRLQLAKAKMKMAAAKIKMMSMGL